jgi:hypothetical protein
MASFELDGDPVVPDAASLWRCDSLRAGFVFEAARSIKSHWAQTAWNMDACVGVCSPCSRSVDRAARCSHRVIGGNVLMNPLVQTNWFTPLAGSDFNGINTRGAGKRRTGQGLCRS